LFEEDNKKWLSELKEGNFKNSEEVAQYVREVKLSLSKTDTRIDNKDRSKSFSAIAIAFSVISLLILGGLIVFRIKELKKNKNIKK
jgi:hypothetical protein